MYLPYFFWDFAVPSATMTPHEGAITAQPVMCSSCIAPHSIELDAVLLGQVPKQDATILMHAKTSDLRRAAADPGPDIQLMIASAEHSALVSAMYISKFVLGLRA